MKTQRSMAFGIAEREQCELLSEISPAEALRYIRSNDFLMQLKEDGDRQAIRKFADGKVFGVTRNGDYKPLPQEIAEAYRNLKATSFLLDGELLDAPHFSVVWDALEVNGEDLRKRPYVERFEILRNLIGPDESQPIQIVLTWDGEIAKIEAAIRLHDLDVEGLVFKKKDAQFVSGRSGQHKKLKFWATCTARVCAKTVKKHMAHNSCALELFDEQVKRWKLVGHVSLNGKPPVKAGDIVEVKYLYYDDNLYQPELRRVRTDVDETACTMSQLKHKAKREDVA